MRNQICANLIARDMLILISWYLPTGIWCVSYWKDSIKLKNRLSKYRSLDEIFNNCFVYKFYNSLFFLQCIVTCEHLHAHFWQSAAQRGGVCFRRAQQLSAYVSNSLENPLLFERASVYVKKCRSRRATSRSRIDQIRFCRIWLARSSCRPD